MVDTKICVRRDFIACLLSFSITSSPTFGVDTAARATVLSSSATVVAPCFGLNLGDPLDGLCVLRGNNAGYFVGVTLGFSLSVAELPGAASTIPAGTESLESLELVVVFRPVWSVFVAPVTAGFIEPGTARLGTGTAATLSFGGI